MMKEYDDVLHQNHQPYDPDEYTPTGNGKDHRMQKKRSYNDRGGYNHNDGQKYVPKMSKQQSAPPRTKDNNRRNDRRDVAQLDDEKMGNMLEKNFKTYLTLTEENEENEDPEEEKRETRPKEPDYSLYKRLFQDYGKKTDKVLYQLITRVFFDTEEHKLEAYFSKYLLLLCHRKCLKEIGISEAISMVIARMPELCLDVPQIDKYLSEYVILPLWNDGQF